MTSDRSHTGEYFLGVTIVLYVVLYFTFPTAIFNAMRFSGALILRLVPVFLFIFVLMAALNYLITNRDILRHFSKGHVIRNWAFAIVGGILSSGPIYMWYPLLDSLREKGVSDGLLAAFLYNRAVKPALLPIMIMYFGVPFVIVLTIVMVFISVLDGLLVEYFVNRMAGGE